MEYMIVTGPGCNELTKNVTMYVARGWAPQGGLAIDAGRLMQAMVRETLPYPFNQRMEEPVAYQA